MRVADLDVETRRLVFRARLMARFPSNRRLRDLRLAVEAWSDTHAAERARNLLRALFDEGILGDAQRGGGGKEGGGADGEPAA